MTPFVQPTEENLKQNDLSEEGRSLEDKAFDFDYISSKTIMDENEGAIFEDDDLGGITKLKDKRLIFIGLGSAILVLTGTLIYLLTREKSVDIEELPVIKADYQPIKERVENDSKPQEDKKIYTYITASDEEDVRSKLKTKPQEISIKEVNKSKLSEADKKMILKAFEELAPNAKRRKAVQQKPIEVAPAPVAEADSEEPVAHIPEPAPVRPAKVATYDNVENSIRRNQPMVKNLIIDESVPSFPSTEPVPRKPAIQPKRPTVQKPNNVAKRKAEALNFLIKEYDHPVRTTKRSGKTVKSDYYERDRTPSIVPQPSARAANSGGVFVQIASLTSRNEAQTEYNRVRRSHGVLNRYSYKIVPVVVGGSTRYRVMVGPFRDKQAASRGVQEMRTSGLRPLW